LSDQKAKVTAMAQGVDTTSNKKKKKNKKGKFAEDQKAVEPPLPDLDSQISNMKNDWEKEKQALLDEKAKIQAEC